MAKELPEGAEVIGIEIDEAEQARANVETARATTLRVQ
jgi:predicted O-methyltransferase YrrM